MIRTPDQRLRVFVSSTLSELADERIAVRRAIERLRLSPVMFELGARPHPPRELYRAYLQQSHVFLGIYWERYGWIAPGEEVSGLEDEYRLAQGLPQLVYIKHPAPDREQALSKLLDDIRDGDRTSYRRFSNLAELEGLVGDDLSLLMCERFETSPDDADQEGSASVPVPLTPIFGREDEVTLIVGLVDQGERCVTVTGPGGVGKTRVALEVARMLAGRSGPSVRYVALATVTSPELAIATVAEALGVRTNMTREPLEVLVEYFRNRQHVLVLDNLEQVIDVRTPLAQLLERAPSVQVLATSRQALRVRGEHEVAMTPLDLPAAQAGVGEVARSPAVELFLDRARALGRPLDLDEANAEDVAALCRRLDGLPLALELAAARLRVMTPRTLLDRLGSALDLCSVGSDHPDRQQTIRATLDWSYDLLDEQECSVLARLSVFAGGATLATVEDVCGAGVDALEDVVAGLLDKSLLFSDAPPEGGEPRLRMLEPVRAFAGERLAESSERQDIRRRHLKYFSALGREAHPFLCGPRQREWATLFDAERANVREAVEAGMDLDEPAMVLRLVWDTLVYFYIRDAVDEVRGWLLRLAAHRPDLDDVGEALLDVGLLVVGEQSIAGEPTVVLARAEPVFATHGLPLEVAVSLHHLGLRHWYGGDAAAAIGALETASGRYGEIDHDWGVATVEMTLGAVYAAGGDRDRSAGHYARSLEHSRCIDNRPQMAQGLHGLALVRALDGRLEEAWGALVEAAEIVLEARSLTGVSYCLEALAAIDAPKGDHEAAARCLGSAREVRRRFAVPEWTAAADVAALVAVDVEAALGTDRFSALVDEAAANDAFVLLEAGIQRRA